MGAKLKITIMIAALALATSVGLATSASADTPNNAETACKTPLGCLTYAYLGLADSIRDLVDEYDKEMLELIEECEKAKAPQPAPEPGTTPEDPFTSLDSRTLLFAEGLDQISALLKQISRNYKQISSAYKSYLKTKKARFKFKSGLRRTFIAYGWYAKTFKELAQVARELKAHDCEGAEVERKQAKKTADRGDRSAKFGAKQLKALVD